MRIGKANSLGLRSEFLRVSAYVVFRLLSGQLERSPPT